METKISLSLLVPGAGLLTQEFCDKNSKESYNVSKISVQYQSGKGKKRKLVKELLKVHTRKQRLVTQHINMCAEAYEYMLATPTEPKLLKVWNRLSEAIRLKHHFDQIAHDFRAVSYSYEILGD